MGPILAMQWWLGNRYSSNSESRERTDMENHGEWATALEKGMNNESYIENYDIMISLYIYIHENEKNEMLPLWMLDFEHSNEKSSHLYQPAGTLWSPWPACLAVTCQLKIPTISQWCPVSSLIQGTTPHDPVGWQDAAGWFSPWQKSIIAASRFSS